MSTITLTFAEAGENGVGQEIIGNIDDGGYTLQDLLTIQAMFPGISQIYDLTYGLQGLQLDVNVDPAYLLVVKNPFPDECNKLLTRLTTKEEYSGVNWDSQQFMKGRLCNKHARYNLLFDNLGNLNTGYPRYISQQDIQTNISYDSYGNIYKRLPDYMNKKGTIYNYCWFPEMKSLVDRISLFPKSKNSIIEGNYYYDVNSTYIGFHGDAERKKVIGCRLGNDFPLHYQWYYKNSPVGSKISFTLNHGDLYVMSEKAVGNDWKRSSILTLRHAAGYEDVLLKKTGK